MSNPLYANPVVGEQTLRALARYPSRTAFSWQGGAMTYRAATDLIGRMQGVFARLGFALKGAAEHRPIGNRVDVAQ